MKIVLRKIIFFILYYIGIGYLLRFYNNKHKKIPIILFHRVTDIKDNYWEPLPTQLFSKIMHFLNEKYEFITISDLLNNDIKNVKNKCIVTFDDGYDDFKENTLPILKKLDIKPTFFITTSCITNNNIVWTSELNQAIENSNIDYLEIKEADFSKTYSLKTFENKIKAANELLHYLKKLNNNKRTYLLDQVKNQLNYKKPNTQNMLSWKDLSSMKDYVDIQSHSVTHPMMTSLTEEELKNELMNSKKEIEENLNYTVDYFSFPIGDYNESVLIETKKHYAASFIVEDRLLETTKLHKGNYNYKLPRINITDKSVYEVFFRINGLHSLIQRKS